MCYLVTGCFKLICLHVPSFLWQRLRIICACAQPGKADNEINLEHSQSHKNLSLAERVPLYLLYYIDINSLRNTLRQPDKMRLYMYVCMYVHIYVCIYACI